MPATTCSWRATSEFHPRVGVVAEGVNVGKLGFEDGLKLGGSDVVVALFADVGVGASVGDELAEQSP